MTDHTHKKVHIKPEGSPNPLQSHSQIVVKVDRDQVEKKARGRRPDHKCDDPPDLSMKDRSRIQHQILNVECRCHHLDQDSDRIQDHNIIHEIRDRVPSEFPFQFVHQIHSVFPFFCENANIPFALPFSYVPYYNSQRFLLSNHLYTASPSPTTPQH